MDDQENVRYIAGVRGIGTRPQKMQVCGDAGRKRVVFLARLKELSAQLTAPDRANYLPGPREPFKRDTAYLASGN